MISTTTVKCDQCAKQFKAQIDISDHSPTIQFNCPDCGAVNKIILQTDSVDKTEVIRQNTSDTIIGAKLEVFDKNEKLMSKIILKNGKNVFGRGNQQEPEIISLGDDKLLSRKHFMIEVKTNGQGKESEYLLCDMESKNGTLLNGEKLSKESKLYLKNSDVITVGEIYILFQLIKF